jgi:hypothetical protein
MARGIAFAFAVVSIAVWFSVLDEWWGLVPALVLCVPVGIAFSLLPSLLVGTVRPALGDVVTTWSFMLVGTALTVYALVAWDGTTRMLVALCGAGLAVGGIGLFFLRLSAMLRHARESRESARADSYSDR